MASRGGTSTDREAYPSKNKTSLPAQFSPRAAHKSAFSPEKRNPHGTATETRMLAEQVIRKRQSYGQLRTFVFLLKHGATPPQLKLIYRHSKREPPRLPTHFWLIKIVSIYIVANNNIMLCYTANTRKGGRGEGEKRQGKCATSLYNSRDTSAVQTPRAARHASMVCCTRQKKNGVPIGEIKLLAVNTV